jgi:hypothetical protein
MSDALACHANIPSSVLDRILHTVPPRPAGCGCTRKRIHAPVLPETACNICKPRKGSLAQVRRHDSRPASEFAGSIKRRPSTVIGHGYAFHDWSPSQWAGVQPPMKRPYIALSSCRTSDEGWCQLGPPSVVVRVLSSTICLAISALLAITFVQAIKCLDTSFCLFRNLESISLVPGVSPLFQFRHVLVFSAT